MTTTELLQTLVDTTRTHLTSLYATIRANESMCTLHLCGFPVTFDLWSSEQRREILSALCRGERGKCGEALERFAYAKNRTTSKGTYYHHVLYPEKYPMILLNADIDIFSQWPAELINQIYLHDVVLRRQTIVDKGRMTRFLNANK
jgi:hypothetical protein